MLILHLISCFPNMKDVPVNNNVLSVIGIDVTKN